MEIILNKQEDLFWNILFARLAMLPYGRHESVTNKEYLLLAFELPFCLCLIPLLLFPSASVWEHSCVRETFSIAILNVTCSLLS